MHEKLCIVILALLACPAATLTADLCVERWGCVKALGIEKNELDSVLSQLREKR